MLDAELYASLCVPQRLAAMEAVHAVWPFLHWPDDDGSCWRSKLSVLDLGCGPGDTTAWVLAPRLPERVLLVGADANPGFVQQARLRNSRAGVWYELFNADGFEIERSLLFRHGPFHLVFSFLLLHRVGNVRRCLENINKLMVDGGCGLFTLIAHSHLYTVYYQMAEDSIWKDFMPDVDLYVSPFYKTRYDVSSLTVMLNDTGFLVQTCWADQKKFVYNSEEQMKGYLRAVNPFVHKVPKEMADAFMDDTLRRCYDVCAVTVEQCNRTGMKSYEFHYRCLTALVTKRGATSY